jgi:Pro-kumamolisin, activation domain
MVQANNLQTKTNGYNDTWLGPRNQTNRKVPTSRPKSKNQNKTMKGLKFSTVLALLIFTNVARADPLDTWTWRNPVPAGNALETVAFVNGQFMVLGSTSTVSQLDAGRWFGTGLMAAVSGGMLLASTNPSPAVERQVLRGHVPEAVARLSLQPAGRLPATNRLNLAIGLPLRKTNALSKLLQDIYDPASPQFRHYLGPAEFAERFGPTEADYQAIIQFADRHGLEVVGTHPNRVLLDVAGTVADIERALDVKLRIYAQPQEARSFFAPENEPSLDLAVPILHISGLENYSVPRPLAKFTRFRQATLSTYPNGSGPWGRYISKDLRAAYAPDVVQTGAGQKVGLFEMDGYYVRDIEAYEGLSGLPQVTLSNVFLNGFNGTPSYNNPEVSLDIEMAVAMAPGLSEVIVYEGINPDDVLIAWPRITSPDSSALRGGGRP